jgi:hypothetical protein
MAEPPSPSSCELLESRENLAFQERSWRWQSVGRWTTGLLVVAAFAGLMGGGPLSHAEAATPDGNLRVEYPRFARNDSSHRILVFAGAEAVVDGRVELSIDAALLDVLQIESVAPEPEAAELGRGEMVYRMRAGAMEGLAPIVLQVKTGGIGRHVGRLGLRGGSAVTIALWLYP